MHPATLSLLRLLDDGRLHTRAGCARALGLADVDAAVAEASALSSGSLMIHDDTLQSTRRIDWLDPARIDAALAGHAPRLGVEVLDCIDSTNAELARRAAAGPIASGTTLTCEMQTAGRGRRGRAWLGTPGGSLAMSMAWWFPGGSAALAGLPLATGVAVVRGLERAGLPGVGLKWPNDLLWQGGKLGGILVESRITAGSGGALAIIGVGINVRLDATLRTQIGVSTPDAPAQMPADLYAVAGAAPDRSAVLAHVVMALADAMAVFGQAGFTAFRDAWQAHHAWHHRDVEVRGAGGVLVQGTVAGIAADGALILDTPDGRHMVHAGDVSLRMRSADATALLPGIA